jgi:hypothetical protein
MIWRQSSERFKQIFKVVLRTRNNQQLRLLPQSGRSSLSLRIYSVVEVDANAVHALKSDGSKRVFALLRFVGRRLTKGQYERSRWFRRIALAFAIGRWLTKRLSRPETIYLSRGEKLDIAVLKKETKSA